MTVFFYFSGSGQTVYRRIIHLTVDIIPCLIIDLGGQKRCLSGVVGIRWREGYGWYGMDGPGVSCCIVSESCLLLFCVLLTPGGEKVISLCRVPSNEGMNNVM
jgi:hypothetical protein